MKSGQKLDVTEQIKTIAIESGLDADKALEIAQKCYDNVYWRPYGGATSFREIDQMEATRDYSYKVDNETYKLRSIVENITETDELDIDGKVSAIQTAAGDFKSRVSGIPIEPGIKEGFWSKFISKITGKKSEPDLEELGSSSFKVFKDKATGKTRWVAFSSNCYEDLDKELFTTAAIEEAIDYADKTNEQGPLCVFHVEEAAIGQCDFQGLHNGFLIESGTFDETDLGKTAEEFFLKTDKEWQVSIGFKFRAGDELDGTYDWFRFRERSVCPMGTAANPYTDFGIFTGGDKEVDERKIVTLTEIFGEDRTKKLLETAEEKSRTLDAANIRHKEAKTEEMTDETQAAILDALAKELNLDPEAVKKAAADVAAKMSKKGDDEEDDEDDEDKTGKPEPVAASTFDEAKMDKLGALVIDLATAVESIQTQIKALQETDDEKVARAITPRGQQSVRPSTDDNTLVEQASEVARKALAENGDQDPASPYVEDILTKMFPGAAN